MRNSLFICLRRTGTGTYAKTQQCVSQHNGRVNFILADCLYKNKKVLCMLRNKKPPIKGGFLLAKDCYFNKIGVIVKSCNAYIYLRQRTGYFHITDISKSTLIRAKKMLGE